MNNPLNKENRDLPSENQSQIETYIPNEIIQSREDTSRKVGKIIYPKDRAGEIVELSNETEGLKRDQLATIQNFESGEIPSNFPRHGEVANGLNKLQIWQFESMHNIIKAQEKAKLKETKAKNLNAAQEISEFNQKRLVDYAKAGGKAVGNLAKYLGIGAGATALWITKFGLEITKETFKASADIWYSLWGAHKNYREKYPNQDKI